MPIAGKMKRKRKHCISKTTSTTNHKTLTKTNLGISCNSRIRSKQNPIRIYMIEPFATSAKSFRTIIALNANTQFKFSSTNLNYWKNCESLCAHSAGSSSPKAHKLKESPNFINLSKVSQPKRNKYWTKNSSWTSF